jgi:hypothetical protein
VQELAAAFGGQAPLLAIVLWRLVRSKCLATVEHGADFEADCSGAAQLRLRRLTAAAIAAKSPSVAARSSSGDDAEVHKISRYQDITAGHAREHFGNLPIPSRTFEPGRFMLSLKRLILCKTQAEY